MQRLEVFQSMWAMERRRPDGLTIKARVATFWQGLEAEGQAV